mgnify:CR=1 FL=1
MNKLIVGQADTHYESRKTNYMFLINSNTNDEDGNELFYDRFKSEWVLDGVGHSNFILEFVYDKT